MIIVRIAEGAWQHAGARFSEWVGTAGLIGWGLMLFNEPDIFAKSPSFSVMARWADQAAWANILLAAGAFRACRISTRCHTNHQQSSQQNRQHRTAERIGFIGSSQRKAFFQEAGASGDTASKADERHIRIQVTGRHP